MSQDELLLHIDQRLSVLDRPLALLKWLAVASFCIGAWAATQQMSIASIKEWKHEQRGIDSRQDAEIRTLEKLTASKKPPSTPPQPFTVKNP